MEYKVLLVNNIQSEFISSIEDKDLLPEILDTIKNFTANSDYLIIINTHGESEVNPTIMDFLQGDSPIVNWVSCSFSSKAEIRNYLNAKLFTMKVENDSNIKPTLDFSIVGYGDIKSLDINN